MSQWLTERNNSHLVSLNGLLDIHIRQNDTRRTPYEGTSHIKESFTVASKTLDGAKYKILRATRGKLLAMLRDVEEAIKPYDNEVVQVDGWKNGWKGEKD